MKADKTWFNHVLIHGVILGLSLSLVEFTALFLGMLFRPVMMNIYVILISLSVYIAIRKYRETELNGIINFGDAFVSGLLVCAFAGVIWAIYRFFQYKYTPGLIDEILRMKTEFLTKSDMTESDKDAFMKLFKMFTIPIVLSIVNTFFFGMVIGGSLISLFLGFVLQRKERPDINK